MTAKSGFDTIVERGFKTRSVAQFSRDWVIVPVHSSVEVVDVLRITSQIRESSILLLVRASLAGQPPVPPTVIPCSSSDNPLGRRPGHRQHRAWLAYGCCGQALTRFTITPVHRARPPTEGTAQGTMLCAGEPHNYGGRAGEREEVVDERMRKREGAEGGNKGQDRAERERRRMG
jgi:hypothetical protein